MVIEATRFMKSLFENMTEIYTVMMIFYPELHDYDSSYKINALLIMCIMHQKKNFIDFLAERELDFDVIADIPYLGTPLSFTVNTSNSDIVQSVLYNGGSMGNMN